MAEADLFEQVRLFLPKYLTPEQARDLFDELSAFPDCRPYCLPPSKQHAQILQGDGWRGLVVLEFHTGEKKPVPGLVLSNSCDIDLNNARYTPPRLLFAPIISMSAYEALLRASLGAAKTESVLDSIRKQRTSSVFYIPAGQIEESLVQLDDIHTHPLKHFLASKPEPLFTLSQFGFYLFLFKLSIHFTRMQEGVARQARPGDKASPT